MKTKTFNPGRFNSAVLHLRNYGVVPLIAIVGFFPKKNLELRKNIAGSSNLFWVLLAVTLIAVVSPAAVNAELPYAVGVMDRQLPGQSPINPNATFLAADSKNGKSDLNHFFKTEQILPAVPNHVNEFIVSPEGVPFNKMYYMMAHNSYEFNAGQASGVLKLLDSGYRSIEIDIWDKDGTGNDYINHGGTAPPTNYKDVNHCGMDGGSVGVVDCFANIRSWRENNPTDVPILIFMDLKEGIFSNTRNDWGMPALRGLNDTIRDTLGAENMITPEEVRTAIAKKVGESQSTQTLRHHVVKHGWPNVANTIKTRSEGQVSMNDLGKFMVFLTVGGMDGVEDYLRDFEGHSLFICPNVTKASDFELNAGNHGGYTNFDEVKLLVCGNIKHADKAHELLNKNFASNMLNHYWLASGGGINDYEYSWNYFSVAHGAFTVNRNKEDFPEPETWGNRLPKLGIRRSVPGYFSIQFENPNNGDKWCPEVSNSGNSDGTPIVVARCDRARINQQFLLTAESQLRPRVALNKCVDVEGAGNGEVNYGNLIHLWDCDGGASEKWEMLNNPDINFRNYEDSHKNLCLAMGGLQFFSVKSGDQMFLRICGQWSNAAERLITQPDVSIPPNGW